MPRWIGCGPIGAKRKAWAVSAPCETLRIPIAERLSTRRKKVFPSRCGTWLFFYQNLPAGAFSRGERTCGVIAGVLLREGRWGQEKGKGGRDLVLSWGGESGR